MSDERDKNKTLWRISAYPDLSGRGGVLASGRWHSAGKPVVYLADSPSSAMLETLVHLEMDFEDLPDTYRLLKVGIPKAASIDQESAQRMPVGWHADRALTQSIGDRWLEEGESLLLEVPSAVMPHTQNYMLNPLHNQAGDVEFEIEPCPFDERLFGRR